MINHFFLGKEMPAGLCFIVQAILGMMGFQRLLHVGALSVRLSEGFLVLMAVCSVRSSCVDLVGRVFGLDTLLEIVFIFIV